MNARLLSLIACLVGVLSVPSLALAQPAAADVGTPEFVRQPLQPLGRGTVVRIVTLAQADVVILAQGYDQGFHPGMRCDVLREGALVAELILVETHATRSAGLITDLLAGLTLRTGDTVRIQSTKTL